jgi:hypothetical protein
LCHPALDRLVFLIEPDGVKIHWLTDGVHDRTGLDRKNAFEEPENRRGEGPPPLRENAWNRAALILQGDTVRLVLNDQAIYERRLNPGNRRFFGLFHFADATAVRARNCRYRGDWPRALPKPESLFEPRR